MEINPPPTPEQLAGELQKFARRGLGRSLPGKQTEKTVQTLSDISRELADDPSEDWPLRIARVVIREVERITPENPDRLAIADVLVIDLEQAPEGLVNTGGDVGPLKSSGPNVGRYARAASRYKPPIVEKTFDEERRKPLLERVGQRLIDRLNEKQAAAEERDEAVQPEPQPAIAATEPPPEDEPTNKPPTLLIGAVGAVLVVVGVAWLILVAIGAIG